MTITINDQPPKFCKDCKYYEKSDVGYGGQYDHCLYRSKTKYNIVTGASWQDRGFCQINRSQDHSCGKEAKWFVKKELDKIPEKCYTGIVERVVQWFKK